MKTLVIQFKEDEAPCGVILVQFSENTSHAGAVKQLIDGLVSAKWASRKEIEEEFVSAIQTGAYRSTTA